MTISIKNNISFYKSALWFIIPISLQALVETLLGLMNTFIVGQFGNDSTVAGVNSSANIYDLVWFIFFAIVAAGNIFFAQYEGVNNRQKIKETTNIKLFYVLIFSIIFLIVLQLFSRDISNLILGGITKERQAEVGIATEYCKLTAWNYPFLGFAYIISITMNAAGKVKAPLIVSACSLVLNTTLACLLSLPYSGSPNLGVHGLAISLIITRVVECLIFIVYMWYYKPIYAPNINIFKFSKSLHFRYIREFLPLVISQICFGFSIIMQTVIFNYYCGPTVVAAVGVVASSLAVFYSTFRGYNALVAYYVGQELGKGELILAKENATKILQLCSFISVVMSIFIVISAFLVPKFLFTRLSKEAIYVATNYLAFSAITYFFINMWQPIFSFLYAGGYTLLVGVVDLFLVWVVDIFITFALLQWTNLSVINIMLISCLVKSIDFTLAYLMYKFVPWNKNLIDKISDKKLLQSI